MSEEQTNQQTSDILKVIRGEVNDFTYKEIQIVEGYRFNQKTTLNDIYLRYNSKFQNGDIDEDGDKKYFYNIVKNPCKVMSKAIDFDTKNIRLLTAEGGNPLKTWYMERDLKFWMRDKQFGKVLNRIFQELPIFGSVVLKEVNGYLYFIDLRNFIVEQSADTLDAANYITEIHDYTVSEFRKVGKELGWNKIDETVAEFRKMKNVSHIRVFERYGELEGQNKNWSYKRVYVADVGVDTENQQREKEPYKGIILKESEGVDHPYWEYHLEKIPGRWLGIGVVETLFEPQIKENEIANLQSKAAYWRSIVLLQSPDPALAGKNLMTEKRNGEVLDSSNGNTTQVDISDKNLAFFTDETNKWLKNRDELTFSYDVVQGERLPAGTPLGSAQIAISQTLSYFEQIQENIAMDVKQMLYKAILPQFELESTPEHTLRLVGKDLDTYVAMIKDGIVFEELTKMILRGKFPTNYDAQVVGITIENAFKKNGELLKKLPRGFYKDNQYDVDIDITGESVDTRVRNATKFAIMQWISTDPTALTDPFKKAMIISMAEDGGINLYNFLGVQQKQLGAEIAQTQAQRGGGGVSSPAIPANPMAGNKVSTI